MEEETHYLLTLERAVPVLSVREALMRAFEMGRAKGRVEGVRIAQKVMTEPTERSNQ